jgi:hypothetical protein
MASGSLTDENIRLLKECQAEDEWMFSDLSSTYSDQMQRWIPAIIKFGRHFQGPEERSNVKDCLQECPRNTWSPIGTDFETRNSVHDTHKLLNFQQVWGIRQTEIQTAEPLMPEPSISEFEVAVGKLKRYVARY